MADAPTLAASDGLAFFPEDASGGFRVAPALEADLASYTLVFDLVVPNDQPGIYGALFQTDADNASDADLFLQRLTETSFGVGISGQYEGEVAAGREARLIFAVTALGDGTSRIDKYVDGDLVGTQTEPTDRFTISAEDGFLILADESGETFAGRLGSFSLLARALTPEEAEALGGPAPGGAFGAPRDAALYEFDLRAAGLEGGSVEATVGEAVIERRAEGPGGVADPTVGVIDPIPHLLLAPGESAAFDLAERFFGEDLTFEVATTDGAPAEVRVEDGGLVVEADALGLADVSVTATDAQGASFTDLFRVRVAGEGAYTIAVLPDTQNYTEANQAILNEMTAFLARNAESLHLELAAHVGDVTGSNLPFQWAIVSEAYEALEAAGVPYTLLPGNHDQADGGTAADHTSLQDDWFGMERYFADAEGGVYDGEPESTKNNYKLFTARDGTDWIVLSLEFGPRDDVIRWAGEALAEHADRRAVVLTHHHTNFGDIAGPESGPLYAEGTGKDYGMATSPEGVNDGRDLWDALLSKHANVSFVFSGHVFGDGAETIVREGEAGNPVHQMLVNYQNGVAGIIQAAGDVDEPERGGNGAMRLLTIDPENDAVHTETYYAHLDRFMTASRGDPEPSRDGSGTIETPERVIQPVEFGAPEALGFPALPEGGEGSAIALPRFDPDNGLRVVPGFAPAEGDLYEVYTLVWDVYIPEGIGLTSILQTDLDNVSDGDLWIQAAEGGGLIGGDNQDDGPFPLGGWSRVAVAFERLEGEEIAYRADKYVDGVPMGSQVFEGDRRIAGPEGFLLFADDGLETPQGWAMSAFAMLGTALDAEAVAALGGVDADGPFDAPPEGVGGVQFDLADGFAPTFGEGTMSQAIGGSGEVSLTGRYLEHQETFEGLALGAPEVQFHADAGADLVAEAGAPVTLDGSRSADLLDQVEDAVWTDADGRLVARGLVAEVEATSGFERYTLTLADGQGRPSRDAATVVGTGEAVLLHDGFDDGDLAGWEALVGEWQVSGAVNSEDGAAEGYLRPLPAEAGLLAWSGAVGWPDHTVRATIENEGTEPMGLAAAVSGSDTHYRLEFDVGAHAIRLVRMEGGERVVLASEADLAPYDRAFDAELAVADGRLTAAVDGRVLFGGAVEDPEPLGPGTVGLFHEGTEPLARIDDVVVTSGATIADAGPDRRVVDRDGDGMAVVPLVPAPSGEQAWTVDGALVVDAPALAVGEHLVEMTAEGGGDADTALVEVVAADAVLVDEDFEDGAEGWRFVDEGELGEPADWSVEAGALVQSADRYSRQLMGSGDTAPDPYWALGWSPLGDGHHVLREGTHAVWDDPAAASWRDVSVEVTFAAPSGGAVGVLLHWQDEANHLKLELDVEGGTSQLVEVRDGVEEIAWQAPLGYDVEGDNRLRVDVEDGAVRAWLDGAPIFEPLDLELETAGTIALTNWGAPGTRYDDVLVVSLEEAAPPPPEEIVGTDGSDRLRGTDGADVLRPGAGPFDVVEGGAGADRFAFGPETANGAEERDLILDFASGEDVIDLNGAAITGVEARGSLVILTIGEDDDVLYVLDAAAPDDLVLA